MTARRTLSIVVTNGINGHVLDKTLFHSCSSLRDIRTFCSAMVDTLVIGYSPSKKSLPQLLLISGAIESFQALESEVGHLYRDEDVAPLVVGESIASSMSKTYLSN